MAGGSRLPDRSGADPCPTVHGECMTSISDGKVHDFLRECRHPCLVTGQGRPAAAPNAQSVKSHHVEGLTTFDVAQTATVMGTGSAGYGDKGKDAGSHGACLCRLRVAPTISLTTT